jgi:hypothetical protein
VAAPAVIAVALMLSGKPALAADTQINTGFDGPTGADTWWWPNDPNAAVGPNHVMYIINGVYRIYTKAGVLVKSGSVNSCFASVGTVSDTLDPNITYDDIAGRFVIEATGSGSGITNSYIAVSDTSDPTQGFSEAHVVGFPNAGDGGKVGFNADAYVINAASGICIIDKSTMLDSNNATFNMTYYQVSGGYGRAARMHVATPGMPFYFTSASGGQIRVTRVDNVLSATPPLPATMWPAGPAARIRQRQRGATTTLSPPTPARCIGGR